MHDPYIVVKILNNNVVVAQEQGKNEVILIGKGIGFGKKKGAHIDAEDVDKLFVLANEHQQEEYKRLLNEIDEELIALIEEAVTYIQTALKQRLDERIHVALTDHIGFAVRRMKQGIDIQNPFLLETEAMFPSEYALAKEVVSLMNNHLDIPLPEAEVGFVALHIYSALSNRSIAEMNNHPQLLREMVGIVEASLNLTFERETTTYLRLISFFSEVIERIEEGSIHEVHDGLAKILKEDFTLCYNVTCSILNLLNSSLGKSVQVEEIPDLVLYLQRFIKTT